MTTAFISHPLFFAHEVPQGHPECASRLSAIEDRLHSAGIYGLLRHYEAPRATMEQVLRVHSRELVEKLDALSPSEGLAAVDPDTFMGSHTLEAAWHAAGAGVLATDLVLDGQVDNAFCAVRPPGHHAERSRAMGFCFFNNIAVSAAHALAAHQLERLCILDFDVHHGNGTEQIFAKESRVLLCSAFQHPFYPYGGAQSRPPNLINVPLPAGTGGESYRLAASEHWLPAVDSFRPQMIFVSAGFDGHREDDLANFRLLDDDYQWLTDTILEIAARHARGRIVSCLEGGYALDALGRCAVGHIRGLAGV